MYTTSRYASAATRSAARALAEKAGEPYAARGKKTIAQLADHARRSGEELVRIVEERDGRAASVAEIRVDEKGGWSWLGERILDTAQQSPRRGR